jgi:radical SAM superfamily enzyme YgiQ (UPF0313 family)
MMLETIQKTEVCKSRLFLEKGEFSQMLLSAKEQNKFSELSALIIDATENTTWDIFRYLQKSVLHLGPVSVATLLSAAGFDDVKAVYEVLTPNYDYSKLKPDLIGLSAIITNVPFANKKMKYFRENNPNALIIAGGAGYSIHPEVAINHGADIVIVGKAEYPLLKLLDRLVSYKKEGENLKNVFSRIYTEDIEGVFTAKKHKIDFAPMVKDLDELPITDYSLIEGRQSRFLRSMMTSDGCVHNCDFCSVIKLNRHSYRKKSNKRTVAEMENIGKDNVRNVFFVDDHAFARGYMGKTDKERKSNLFEFLESIKDSKIKRKWIAQVTIDSIAKYMDDGIIDLLEKSNCGGLCFGVESISDKDLKSMNAGNKNSIDKLKRVLGALKKSPIEAFTMFVLKHAVEKGMQDIQPYSFELTRQGIRDYRDEMRYTIDLMKKYDVRAAQFHSPIPLPTTKSAENSLNAGIVLKKVGGKLVDTSKYTGQYVIASADPYLSYQIMLECYKRFYSRDYSYIRPIKDMLYFSNIGNACRKLFYRAAGRIITDKFRNTPEAKEYINALKRGDYEFYKPGEKLIFS